MLDLVSALNKVDLPTLGSPTKPALMPMVTFQKVQKNECDTEQGTGFL